MCNLQYFTISLSKVVGPLWLVELRISINYIYIYNQRLINDSELENPYNVVVEDESKNSPPITDRGNKKKERKKEKVLETPFLFISMDFSRANICLILSGAMDWKKRKEH